MISFRVLKSFKALLYLLMNYYLKMLVPYQIIYLMLYMIDFRVLVSYLGIIKIYLNFFI